MSEFVGARNTFNDTVGVKTPLKDLAAAILDPSDTPLYDLLPKVGWPTQGFKIEWQETGLLSQVDTLAAAADAGDAAFTVSNPARFKAGDVIKAGSEFARVSGVAGNSVSVARGYAGTTAAAHANGAEITIVAQAVPDGADPEAFRSRLASVKSNFYQWFQEAVEITTQDEFLDLYGEAGHEKFSRETAKKLREMAIRRERSIHFGRKTEDLANQTRTMDGISAQIVSNAIEVNGPLTETALNEALRASYRAGGRVTHAVVDPIQKGAFTSMITPAMIQYPSPTNGELTFGRTVGRYMSDYGPVDLVLSRWATSDEILLLDREKCRIVVQQDPMLENLAKTGMARKAQIIASYSTQVEAEAYSAKLTKLTA